MQQRQRNVGALRIADARAELADRRIAHARASGRIDAQHPGGEQGAMLAIIYDVRVRQGEQWIRAPGRVAAQGRVPPVVVDRAGLRGAGAPKAMAGSPTISPKRIPVLLRNELRFGSGR